MQNSHGESSTDVDVLVVGSGPAGATYARVISERAPQAKILMMAVGPQRTDRPGVHVKNIDGPQARTRAQVRPQGPSQFEYEIRSFAERAHAAEEKRGRERIAMLARPGTHLINPDDADIDRSGMPAAAAATNVGGAGAHWTGA